MKREPPPTPFLRILEQLIHGVPASTRAVRYLATPFFCPLASRYMRYFPLCALWGPVFDEGVFVPRLQPPAQPHKPRSNVHVPGLRTSFWGGVQSHCSCCRWLTGCS